MSNFKKSNTEINFWNMSPVEFRVCRRKFRNCGGYWITDDTRFKRYTEYFNTLMGLYEDQCAISEECGHTAPSLDEIFPQVAKYMLEDK